MSHYTTILGACLLIGIVSCSNNREKPIDPPSFTKADSLTERYLDLQDSMLYAWNTMLNDEKQKFRAMHDLLHELITSNQFNQEELVALDQQLEELSNITLAPGEIDKTAFIEEYDFATNHIIKELTSLLSDPTFSQSDRLQKMANEIMLIDQRVEVNRSNYDAIVREYNTFIQTNRSIIKEVVPDTPVMRMPLFSMTEEN